MQTQPFGIRITQSSFLFSTSAQIVNMLSMHWVVGIFGIQIFLVHLWIFSQAVINYMNIKCDLKTMPMHCKFNQITD